MSDLTPPKRPDGGVATGPAPSESVGQGQNTTTATTFFTKADGKGYTLYTGDRMWARVKVQLETAGPVVVGFNKDMSPLFSGKGQMLATGQQREFTVSKGDVLYIAATSINRVAVTVEPFAWLEQVVAFSMNIAKSLLDALGRKKVGP